MARNLSVYPKASLVGSSWKLVVKVKDDDTGSRSRFVHPVPAGVTAETPLSLLKLAFDLIVGDTDTDQDVDDALFVDDIKPGGGYQTVWGNWIEAAEDIISGLDSGYSVEDFWGEWAPNDTNAIRSDARRALITQRGWTVPVGSIHQHEGDGSVTEE